MDLERGAIFVNVWDRRNPNQMVSAQNTHPDYGNVSFTGYI